ncbi:MAG: DUF4160 domain-containing protein [Alphaproteobacteria bacterium]
MPIICQFLGVIITMYYYDHAPPHFHARYGGYEITVNILTGLVTGTFPKRALRFVLEWYELHHNELIENWERCQNAQPLLPIQPLE